MQGTMGALGGTWNSFIGDIAVFKLYNSELSAAQVAQNFSAVAAVDRFFDDDGGVGRDSPWLAGSTGSPLAGGARQCRGGGLHGHGF